MKSPRAHRVPLCGRALEILDAARKLGGGGSLIVFVGKRGREMGGEQMGRLLRKHGIAGSTAWVSVVVQGLGGRRDGPLPRSRRGSPGPCGPEPGRGRLHALRLVRAPPSAHGRLGGLSRGREVGPRAAPSGGARRAISEAPAGLAESTLRCPSQPTLCGNKGAWRGVAPPPLRTPQAALVGGDPETGHAKSSLGTARRGDCGGARGCQPGRFRNPPKLGDSCFPAQLRQWRGLPSRRS